ncbi:sensor domain CHASE2-containing protein [Parasphingorhabdus marina DSM 22363]|uniref:histidine kinase n=1 Tax=Parasphingorhabdus marina DSM 22363 TaxID=1123272 RepID=A0A1N6D5H8_9SPHN|nr:CHASE2 domain-containing protein [Parasphingorhabdus marina]SIN66009.1 sensor domain CHASE2-containing protein [Parasphingorhabdus marina DSM 22363]
MKLRRRLGIEWAGVAILSSLVVALLIHWNSLSRVDHLLYDQLSGLERPEASSEVLIIGVDEDSLAQFGKWPWSRDRHAELFRRLEAGNPKAIAFDIILSERGDPKNDQLLSDAMARNPGLFLPLHFVFPGRDGAAFDVKEPLPQFRQVAAGVGHVNLVFDDDGVVRRAALCFAGEGERPQNWPHLMEQLYRHLRDGRPSPAFQRLDRCDDPLLMPWSERNSFAAISYSSIANGEVPPAFLEDKVLLIGATASGLGDRHNVPLNDGGSMDGVEIMANLLGALERDDFVAPLAFWQQLALSLAPLWILLAGFWRWRPRSTIFISIGLIAMVLGATALLLAFRLWFAPGAALVGLALVYPVWGWRRLQATSDFMDEELENFRASKVDIPVVARPAGPVDVVTGQAEELTHAISHMRDLRRFISDALSNLPDPMFITDLEGRVKFVNKLAQIGFEPAGKDQELALDDMLARFVTSGDLPEVREYLAMDRQSQELDYVEFTSLNDEVFAMRRAQILSDDGDLRGHIHYLADITQVANAAEEREEVLQLLSHDMRAPQAAILALLDSTAPSDSARRIEEHARRTLALADNFVGLARIKSSEFAGEDILLSDLVVEASDSLWPLAEARKIKCRVEDKSDGAFIVGEPSSLHRSFVNLIDNAIKYSPDKGAINIGLRRIDLDKQPFVSIEISDQGPGVSPDMIGQLFERFASDDSQAQGQVKGSGLGLSFVAAVIERHGGSVRAENLRNGGARFTVLLPVAPDIAE